MQVQKDVGAVILQKDRLVAYALKALTLGQQNYTQIEKEMLAIVFGRERIHGYLYGQREVTVESDHEPLDAILKKPIHQEHLRLRKIIFRIKLYVVKVKCLPDRNLSPKLTNLSKMHTNLMSSKFISWNLESCPRPCFTNAIAIQHDLRSRN